MCYDISFLTHKKNIYEKRFNAQIAVKHIDVEKTYHAMAFDLPDVPCIKHSNPSAITSLTWGLIPSWVQSVNEAEKIRYKTANARAETVFEKHFFNKSAKNKRCIVIVDGFFEHHHVTQKKIPFFIRRRDDNPFALAGIWDEWSVGDIKRETFSILTTAGNSLLGKIHNNPQMSGPRMPFILDKSTEDLWLNPDSTEDELKKIMQPYDLQNKILEAFPVGTLRGKNRVGNTPQAIKSVYYPEIPPLFF